MKRRHRVHHRHSKKHFSKYAKRVHKRNLHAHPMRGGFRI